MDFTSIVLTRTQINNILDELDINGFTFYISINRIDDDEYLIEAENIDQKRHDYLIKTINKFN